jgi:hypothetical protein
LFGDIFGISPAGILAFPAPPDIAQSPANRTVLAGQTVAFSAQVTGSLPLAFQWYFEGNLVSDSATNTTLILSNVTGTMAGDFTLVASNALGSATSNPALLTVLPAPLLVSSRISGAVQFSAAGVPGHKYWVQATTNLNAPAVWVNVFTNSVAPDGTILFTDTNKAAYPKRFFRLLFPSVLSAVPAIIEQPVGQTVLAGKSLGLSVAAAGVDPLSYQWYLNSPLPGASTSVFNVSNALATDSGKYFVVVSNLFGSVTSSIANVTVLPPPQMTLQPGVGGFRIAATAVPGDSYVVQTASNLIPPVGWSTVWASSVPTNGTIQFTDTNTTASSRFYRLLFP